MAIYSFKKMTAVFLVTAFGMFILSGCGSGKNDDSINGGNSDKSGQSTDPKDTLVKSIFYSVPSPIETASLIQRIGVPYDKEYLNDIKKLSSYSTTGSKALNLGVYGADLSFTSIYDQNQESMLYLKCTNTLANGLGISGAFDETTANRLEANKNNKDSLLGIISESFWTADAFLKENERPGTSSLIIVGGWIESVYIASRIQEASKNKEIETRIAEQKYTLSSLVKMTKRYASADQTVADVYNDLVDLQNVYNTIEVSKEKATASKDASGVTTIGGKASLKLTAEQLKSITEKVRAFRAKIIK